MKLALKLPSLSITRGQIPDEAGPNVMRRMRGVALWGAVSLGFFLVFAWLCLPTRAIAWRISHEARKAGYIVEVKNVSVNLLGDITLEEVTWTFAPSRPDQAPRKFLLEEVVVDVSFLSLVFGNLDVEIEAHPVDGLIIARYERDAESSTVHVEISDLPLYDVPKASQALNAPLSGLFALQVDLEVPGNKFSKAQGTLELTCAGCKIGDGETKLYIPGSKGLKDGTVIPEIDLGTFVGKMIVDKGVAKTDGPMETKSDDVEVSVEGEITLKDPFQKSRLDLTAKVNLTEALQQRSEKLRVVFQSADLKSRLDPPEQGLGYILSGPLGSPKFSGIKAKTARESRAERRAKQRAKDEKRKSKAPSRPTVTDPTDDKPALPGAPGGPGEDPPGADDPNVPSGSAGGAEPQNAPLPPPTGLPPVDPAGAPPVEEPPPAEPPPTEEPLPEPVEELPPEPLPPEEPVDGAPNVLPPDGNFGGSGDPIGELQ